jgi:hypothetical protein
MLFNKVNEDLSIVTIESKNAVSANGGFTVKDILAENKNNVIILFRLSQNFNTHRPDFVPKLLFCDLINFAVFNDIERAKNKNITLVCIHGLVEFISSLETGRQTIIDLGTKGYSFGFDIENVRFTEKKIVGIVDMLFSICKTQFIHRNVDPQIQEYFLKYSEDARLVFPKFQYLEIKSKFAKISSQEHNEASNAQIAERKKALVSQFSTLVPGTAIFKTIYYSSRGSMNIDVQEDIVYNTPIEIRKFANAIASISDSNPYASELDAKEKRKIPNSVSNNVNTIGTTNNNVGTNNYDDSDEEIYIIGGDEEQNAAPIYIPDVDNPQKISNLPTVKKKK